MATVKSRNICLVCKKPRIAGTNHGKCVESLAAAEPKSKKKRPLKSMLEDVKFFEKINEDKEWQA